MIKIVGIGLNKTGTTTLRDCLRILGYRVKGFDRRLTAEACRGELDGIYRSFDAFDAFQDFPWPLVYRQLDALEQPTRFILTTRRDSATWFESQKKHAYYTGPREVRELVYGSKMPHLNRPAIH